jgi:sodium-dependent dicarboxylate transporter 2/3/5
VVLGLVMLTIVGWVSETWHGIPSPTIAMALAALFFISRLLTAEDFVRLDWSTIALIGGGIALGRLLEHTGLIVWFSQALGTADLPLAVTALLFAIVAAFLSAVMSNTATAIMFIPLASALDPTPPVLTIVVALACSFGVPFIVSTPQNAMAVGAGARSSDLLRVGLPVMILGCALLILCRPLIALIFAA